MLLCVYLHIGVIETVHPQIIHILVLVLLNKVLFTLTPSKKSRLILAFCAEMLHLHYYFMIKSQVRKISMWAKTVLLT